MSSKELTILLNDYLREFEREFINTVNTDEKEAIHEMRVAIKRLKALLVLFEESKICTKNELKKFKRMKHIFDISGELREHQIKIDLLEYYKHKLNQRYDNLKKSLLRIAYCSKEQYWKEMKNISFIEIFRNADLLNERILSKKNKKIRGSVKKFVDKRINKSYIWLRLDNFRDYLHEIRKYLKNVRFVMEQLEMISNDLYKRKLKFKKYKQVEDLLGEWHDLDLFLCEVKEYKERKTGYTVGLYDDLIKEIEVDLKRMETEMRPVLIELAGAYLKLTGKKVKIDKVWTFTKTNAAITLDNVNVI